MKTDIGQVRYEIDAAFNPVSTFLRASRVICTF